MNLGFPKLFKVSDLIISPINKPVLIESNINNFNWVSGLGFFVNITSSFTCKLGVTVKMKFQITQHIRDIELMKKFIAIFQCGRIETVSQKLWSNFVVTKFKDIFENIIPFFEKYPIQGKKSIDFFYFKEAHLSKEGICKIRSLKLKMN